MRRRDDTLLFATLGRTLVRLFGRQVHARTALLTGLVSAGAVLVPASGIAQLSARDESRLLREAAAAESDGDYEASAALLTALLEDRPASSGAVFALERVLRADGRLGEVLQPIEAFIRADPTSAGPRYLKLRILLELDSLAALRPAGEDWIRTAPTSENTYREVARVYEQAFGGEAALAVLRRGQAAGDEGSLALETGELVLRLGRPREALREWARGLEASELQAPALLERMVETARRNPALVSEFVSELVADSASEAKSRAAFEVALAGGRDEEALRVVRRVLTLTPSREREGFLTAVSRLAHESGASELAAWTAEELRRMGARGREVAVLFTDPPARSEASSPERRRAAAEAIRRDGAADAPSATLLERFDGFREEYPDAPETDPLAVALSARFRETGDTEAAVRVLDGVEGPLSARARAWLAVEAGDLTAARAELAAAARGLPPVEATAIVQLTGILARVGEHAAELAAGSAALHHREGAEAAFTLLARSVHTLPPDDQPPLLAMAARLAGEAGLGSEAARMRETLVATFPEARETPEAMLQLARYRAAGEDGVTAAVELLEELILSRPESAVVPIARRELERLRAIGHEG